MNQTIENFARSQIIKQCESLPYVNQRVFRLMYGRKTTARGIATRSVEEAEKLNIPDLVAEIPEEKLDWALQQLENTHQKLVIRNA